MMSMDFLWEDPEAPGGEKVECCVTFGLSSGKDAAAPRGVFASDLGEAGRVLGGVWTGSQGEIRMSTLERE